MIEFGAHDACSQAIRHDSAIGRVPALMNVILAVVFDSSTDKPGTSSKSCARDIGPAWLDNHHGIYRPLHGTWLQDQEDEELGWLVHGRGGSEHVRWMVA